MPETYDGDQTGELVRQWIMSDREIDQRDGAGYVTALVRRLVQPDAMDDSISTQI